MIQTTYTYSLDRKQLERLQKLKEETGVPIAKQLDYAVELLFMEYDWDRDAFKKHLEAYVKGLCG